MKHRPLAMLLFAGLLAAGTAHANQAEHIQASKAWIRVLPGALPAGGYVTLHNDSDQPAALSSASSAVYGDVMLHKTSTEMAGMSQMTMVDRLDVPAHGEVSLAPAGYHLMLSEPSHPVKAGDTVKLTLKFADGSTRDVDFLARPANTVGADEGYFGHTMGHATPVPASSH